MLINAAPKTEDGSSSMQSLCTFVDCIKIIIIIIHSIYKALFSILKVALQMLRVNARVCTGETGEKRRLKSPGGSMDGEVEDN